MQFNSDNLIALGILFFLNSIEIKIFERNSIKNSINKILNFG